MARHTFLNRFRALYPAETPGRNDPVALHSMLLALEPRMLFDASAPAAAGAIDAHDVQPAMQSETGDARDAPDGSAHAGDAVAAEPRLQGAFDLPANGTDWSAPSEVDFSQSPGDFTLAEGGTLSLGGKITVADPDSDDLTVTVKVANGTLALDYVPGVVGNQYSWNADHTEVTFSADKAVAQQVLDTLRYTGNKYYNGSDTLTVVVSDGYNTDQNFSQSLIITPVADAPVFQGLPDGTTIQRPEEDVETSITFNYGTSTAPDWRPLSVVDPDSGDDGYNDTYDLSLTVSHGTLSSTYEALSLGSGIRVGDTTTYSLSGRSLQEINGLLANLTFLGDKDFNGKAELGVSIHDVQANASLDRTFEVDVLPVNDAPTFHPADSDERGLQLVVKELDPMTGESAEGFFDLSHFHTGWNALEHTPTNNGNDPLDLFDVDNNLHQLVVRVDQGPAQGDLWRQIGSTWVKLGDGSTFSLWDVYSGNVKYVHDPAKQVNEAVTAGSESDFFTYTVNDGAGGTTNGTIHIALEPVNQAPEVVVEAIPGLIESDRLDYKWVTDPQTGEQTIVYTVWGYEGEQGIPFAFTIVDPDQAPGADFTVEFTALPDPTLGYFWYNDGAGWAKVVAGQALSLELIQQGNLRFCHSGVENGGSVTFSVAVTDDGGGEGAAGAKTTTADLVINIRANNDHPEWDVAGGIWDDAEHTVTVDGTRTVSLDNSFFNTRDNEGASVTYTITGINGDSGQLLYYLGQDGGNQPIYRVINAGDKITQADIDSGNVCWRFNGSGDKAVDISFIVRDGSITACPVPSDSEQTVDYPYTGSSSTNWQHGSGAHEGGIGTWVSDGNGGYTWVLTEHTLHVVATNVPTGETTIPETHVDPVPDCSQPSSQNVVEGNLLNITSSMLNAWFYDDGQAGKPVIDFDETGCPVTRDNLTYRIESIARHGWVLYSDDGGATFSIIGLNGSFTQADVAAGRVYYLHDGSENFSDSFSFSLSDGRNQVTNTQDGSERFTQSFLISPRNDSPRAEQGADVVVSEHDLPAGQSATSADEGGSVTITTDHVRISDPDRGSLGGALDPGGYSDPNDVYIVITDLPEHGTLYYDGHAVVPAAAPAALQAGTGQAGWGANPGFTVISLQDIMDGKLTYRHDGDESFYDGFSYLVSDNKGISPDNAAHNSYQLIDDTIVLVAGAQASVSQYVQSVNIVVNPVNDRPEAANPPATIVVDEGGSVVLKGTAAGTGSNIAYADPDGTPEAIQFIVTELPEHGDLLLNGAVLGIGSTFTQADVDAGRVTYAHDGTEHHSDTFKCQLSDSIYTSDVNSEVFTIIVNPVNKAPTLDVPDTLFVDSIAGGVIVDGITVLDPDNGGCCPAMPAIPAAASRPIPSPWSCKSQRRPESTSRLWMCFSKTTPWA